MKTRNFLYLLLGGIVLMGGLGLGGLPFHRIDEVKTYPVDQMDDIQVILSTYPIHVLQTTEGSDIKFHLSGRSMQPVKLAAALNGKTLLVEKSQPNKFDLPNDLVLEIFIPENYQKNLSIDITTGKAKIDSLHLASFSLHTTTGGMEAGGLMAEKINLVTSTGNIKINQLQTRDLEIFGTTGNISVDDCALDTAKIETTTGDVILRDASGNFNIGTTTGKVILDSTEIENRTVAIGTSTGSISVQLPRTAEFSFEAKSSTGRLKSDFPFTTNEKKRMAGQIGSGSSTLDLHSSTGSITISKK